MNRWAFLLAPLLVAATASAATASEKYKDGDRFLTREQLQEFGPVEIKLGDGRGFVVQAVSLRAEPDRNCRLDIKSLSDMVADKWGSLEGLGVREFELKAHPEGPAGPVCAGGGKGCVVILKAF